MPTATATAIHLDDVRRAWEARDPDLVRLVELLAAQPDTPRATPRRQGALTFQQFLRTTRARAFRKKTRAEQGHQRVEMLKALEAPGAEVPLSDRLRLHEILLQLWEDNGPFARGCLLKIVAGVPLVYGPWKALKRIFKEAEARGDTEMFGAVAARVDAAHARRAGGANAVSRDTLGYLARRAWRLLRRVGKRLPAAYADTAADVLAAYDDATRWDSTWLANHVFYHETRQYGRRNFHLHPRPESLTKFRAFADLWQRTPRPLFALLERARSDRVREFAAAALKSDFRAVLREVEPSWVARLVNARSQTIDEFVVWILQNVPRFEQSAFKALGLHEAVLKLFDSPSDEARAYAAEYGRTHARDLPVEELIRLANNEHEAVRGLAEDLLRSRDPRKEIGLEAWGRLLETEYGHELAEDVLRKSFGARELTGEWFKGRLLSASHYAFDFAKDRLPEVHPYAKLGAAFFVDLLESIDTDHPNDYNVAQYATQQLNRFDLNSLEADFLKRLLIHPLTGATGRAWVDQGRLETRSVPAEFLKTLAYHVGWEADPWVAALKQSGKQWAKNLTFSESVADWALGLLKDLRRYGPADLGFDWLMNLVARSEPRYHDFAVEYMVKAFAPADFAPKASADAAAKASAGAKPAKAADLKGASFLFTGTLSTMKRKEAEDKVRSANGANFSAVSAKLHYLVIGDEGSPLYGHGKKGSKQLAAEKINAEGGNIKIISETAFLKMLAGERQEASSDATGAGARRLWEMLTAPGAAEAPLAAFALQYVRRHHPDIALAETDRPVDPGSEIPASFLTFERVKPLFAESRKGLRELALELARYEFARWAPPIEEIIALSELPYGDVRQFVVKALLAGDAPEATRYRVDPAVLTPAAVYRFVESADEATRELGMTLIQRSPRLQIPEELFRLTESPDRRVRAFVIKALSSLYRDRGITEGWKPSVPPQPTVGVAAKKAAAKAAEQRGPGAPERPEQLPAEPLALRALLRRMLFEVPPARLQPAKGLDGEGEDAGPGTPRLKPLPARKAKLALVDVMRDLAVEDGAFARVVLPPLREFMVSRGQSEHAACLVAVTRIRHTHPELSAAE